MCKKLRGRMLVKLTPLLLFYLSWRQPWDWSCKKESKVSSCAIFITVALSLRFANSAKMLCLWAFISIVCFRYCDIFLLEEIFSMSQYWLCYCKLVEEGNACKSFISLFSGDANSCLVLFTQLVYLMLYLQIR